MREIDYADIADMMDEIYGNTNPDCSGHRVFIDGVWDTVWCDFVLDCPDNN